MGIRRKTIGDECRKVLCALCHGDCDAGDCVDVLCVAVNLGGQSRVEFVKEDRQREQIVTFKP
jgi:hypothetical protein